MSLTNLFSRPAISTIRSNATVYIVLMAGMGLAILAGYLVVTGNWMLGVAALLALPAFIVLHRYPWMALLIWLFVVPLFSITPDARGRQIYWIAHRTLPLLTLIIMLLASRFRMKKYTFPKLGWPESMMAVYLVFGLFSIFFLNDSPQATFYLFYDRVIIPMCLYLLIRLWAPGEEDLKRLAPVVFFLLMLQVIVGLTAWYSPSFLPSAWVKEEFGRTTGTLSSYGAYAATMLFCGLFLLQSALNHKKGLVRNVYLLAFILAGFGVFMSFSRGAWTAGLVVMLGLLLIDQKRVIQVALITIPLLYFLAAGPLASQLDWANERLYSERSEQSALIRLPVFQASVRMFAEKPLFGWGYENFNLYDTQFYSAIDGVAVEVKDLSSHNFFLTLLAEQGLLGTLLFLFPFFWWLARTVRELPRRPVEGYWGRKSLILSWLFVLGYIVINTFHNMRVVFGLSIWWVGLGLIAAALEHKPEPKEPASPSAPYSHRNRLLP